MKITSNEYACRWEKQFEYHLVHNLLEKQRQDYRKPFNYHGQIQRLHSPSVYAINNMAYEMYRVLLVQLSYAETRA